MRQVFNQKEDAEKFERTGFLRRKMLDQLQVTQLKALYHEKFPNGSQNFYSSTFVGNVDEKKNLNEQLVSLLNPVVEECFHDYKILGAQFLVKNPGEGGVMPFHQDWTIVDEEKDRSITVWIALNETTETNGAIQVVPYSHEFSRYKRGPGNFDFWSDVQPVISQYAHTLLMQSGEAFVFDHSIIHGSSKNVTDQPRIAVAFGLVHKEADLIFYHRNGVDQLDKYKVRDDFFITFPNDGNAPPEGELVETIHQECKKPTKAEFEKRMNDLFQSLSVYSPMPLFSDPNLQADFSKNGFVKIPLLNSEEVEDLKAYYLSLNHDHIKDYGFHISLENESDQYRSGVFNKLFSTIMPRLDPLLLNYQAFTASYVIKEAGLQNIVPPHQDWSFVDETEFCSATVWVALMDVNKNNGALGVIRGSHRVFNYPRASPSPQAKSILSDHVFTLFPFVEVIDMKAGEALIFNNKTIHASPPNISGITRIAAGIGITQKNAQLRHYYQTPGEPHVVQVYEVDSDFFPNYNNSKMSAYYNRGEKPQNLPVIEYFNKIAPEYSKEEMVKLVTTIDGVTFNSELMQELADMYHYNMDGTKKVAEEKAENVTEEMVVINDSSAESSKRGFFQTYTPSNIWAEVKYRLSKK